MDASENKTLSSLGSVLTQRVYVLEMKNIYHTEDDLQKKFPQDLTNMLKLRSDKGMKGCLIFDDLMEELSHCGVSAFKLRTTIGHTGRVCNTPNQKLLIQHTNSDNLKPLLTSCSNFLLIEGLNTKSRGTDESLPTDTTELSSMNVEHKKQRRSKLDQFHRRSRENWQKQK